MTKIDEVQAAVASLPADEYAEFRRWFIERDWENWDREIAADAQSGKLDSLLHEAADAKKAGRLRDL